MVCELRCVGTKLNIRFCYYCSKIVTRFLFVSLQPGYHPLESVFQRHRQAKTVEAEHNKHERSTLRNYRAEKSTASEKGEVSTGAAQQVNDTRPACSDVHTQQVAAGPKTRIKEFFCGAN